MSITFKKPKPVPNSLKMLKAQPVKLIESEVDKIAANIKSRMETCLAETGKDLLKAKNLLPHGEFQSWLKDNFGWSLSTAQKLMNVANDPKSVNFTDLPKAAQYALAAPSTPEKVKDAVIADMKTGKKPTVKAVKAKIAAAKPAPVKVAPEITTTTQAVKVKVKSAVPAKGAPDLVGDLVERLQAVGLEMAIAAMEVAFPGTELELRLVDMEAA